MSDILNHEKRLQIGRRIRDERKKSGLSQFQLAEKVTDLLGIDSDKSISQNTISDWEHGNFNPRHIETLFALAQVFHCDCGYLLCDYDEPVHDMGTICDSIGLSFDTVRFLHTMHSVLPFGERNLFVRAIDFLVDDAAARQPGDNSSSLLWMLSFFLKLDASDNKQVYVMNASGDIKPFDSQGGRRVIRSDEIAFDGDMSDAVALAAINQKLHTLKAAQKRKLAARKRNKGK